jgi:peptidoglycan/xylan/chitin deacetylase (PgdA/CDA1 family)
VEKSVFERIVATLRALGDVIPLHELLALHHSGAATAGFFALTFDDAYAGIEGSLGWLSESGIPATVFVVSSASEHGGRFWWDRIDELHPRCSPERWRRFEDECGLPDPFRKEQSASLGLFGPLRQWLLSEHNGRWPTVLEPHLQALEEELGHSALHRAMDMEELARCAALPGIEFGIHTVTHPVLPLLSSEELAVEIRSCHAWLSESFSNVVPILAIPFGLFDRRTLDVAANNGISNCLSVQGALLVRGTLRAIPRVLVRRDEKRWKLALRTAGLRRQWRSPSNDYPSLPSATT